MNILVIHQYFLEKQGVGGSRFNQFAKYWTNKGHKITVIAGTVDYATGKKNKRYKRKFIIKEQPSESITVLKCFTSENYNNNFLGRLWTYFSFTLSSTLAGIFSVGKQDIIIVTSPPLFVAIPGYVISRIKRIPLIFEVRDIWPKFAIDIGVLKNSLIIKLSYWLENFIYKKANLINILTPAFEEYIIKEKKIPEDKIIYIPNGADLDIIKPGLRDNWVRKKYKWNNKFVILYVGAHGIANDLWQIINVAELLRENKDVLFVLIGDGIEKSKLKLKVQNENLKNIQFLNPISKEKIGDFINTVDICTATLEPIFTTTYPNKVFDYMACAKPIVLPIDGVCRQLIVSDAKAGLFVKPDDAEDFKNKILYLYTHSNKAKQMGQNGYNFVKKNFDRKKLANKYLEIMFNLLER